MASRLEGRRPSASISTPIALTPMGCAVSIAEAKVYSSHMM